MATTVNINTSGSDGQLLIANATYATAHDAAVADAVASIWDWWHIGQYFSSGNYYIYRAFLYFDTSGIPDDAIILSAVLKFHLVDDQSDDDFNIVIRRNTPGTYPSDPLVTSDFDYTFYTGDGGSLHTSQVVAGENEIILNSTGRSWINLTGTTKLALISSQDINAVDPTGNEYLQIYSYEKGSIYIPKLTIIYAAEGYPTVTTQAASNVGNSYCTANGTLTDGGLATEWGFELGESETPTWTLSQTGNIGEQAFALGISGLEPSTTYYCRAYATNSFGTAYGAWVSFTTTGTLTPTHGMYEEDNSATVSFYVRQVGGKWSIKHGPYTTDQANIEITKILTEGKGKYQIKFESDVLTGISASVMVKVDIKAR